MEKKIEDVIKNIDEEKEGKVDWTNSWGKKYPVLLTYPKVVDIDKYSKAIRQMLDSLVNDYGYSKLDSMLVLMALFYHEWKAKK